MLLTYLLVGLGVATKTCMAGNKSKALIAVNLLLWPVLAGALLYNALERT